MKDSLRRFIKSETRKTVNFDPKLNKLNFNEQEFCRWAMGRMNAVHRPSWPDFLLELEDGELVAVEVKSRGGNLSRNQRKTFQLLSAMGMRIFIWRQGQLLPFDSAVQKN